MTTTGLEPETADLEAPVDVGEVDSNPAETEGAEPAPAAADTGKPPRDRVQERIDTLTREKYEGLSRAERAEYHAQELERRLSEIEAKSAKPQTVAPSDEFPTLESVGWDEDKHRAAIATWVQKQTGDSVKSVLAQEREALQREQSARDWDRKQREFSEKNPDYVQKVIEAGRRGEWVCSSDMAKAIQQSDIGPEIAAYLAENASKSFEIARLPSFLQAHEIGRIAGRLEAVKAAPPPVSKAPAPVTKIDSGDSASRISSDDPESDKLSQEDWFKAEKRRMANMSRRR